MVIDTSCVSVLTPTHRQIRPLVDTPILRVTWMSSCWLGALVSVGSAVREGRCEKVALGRDRKELSSSPSLIRKSSELATETQEGKRTKLLTVVMKRRTVTSISFFTRGPK